MNTKALITLIAACLALCVPALPAQAQSAEAEVSRTRAYVGDEVLYTVAVSDARPSTQPDIDFPSSVRAAFAGTSTQSYTTTEFVNGQRQLVNQNNLLFQYRLTVLEPGPVEIPAATVTLPDGSTLTTSAVRFDALLPQPATDFELELDLDRPDLFLGETVTATIVWTIASDVSSFTFDPSAFPDSVDVAPAKPDGTRGSMVQFDFRGQRAFGIAEQVFVSGGQQRTRFAFPVQITPRKPGPLTLGPLRVVFERSDPRQGRVRAYTESQPVQINVRALPTQGKPAGFTGVIGAYTASASATPTTVNVGDPITLRFEIKGDEPMVGADTPPDLANLAPSFRVAPEGWTREPSDRSGRRSFTTTIRALSAEVTEIPPIAVDTFDPERAEYVRLTTDPIPLTVRSVREATIADAVIAPGSHPGEATANRPELSPSSTAFWAAPTPEQVARARPFDLVATLSHPATVALLTSAPLSIVLGAGITAAHRRRQRPGARVEHALRRAEHVAIRSGPAPGARAATAAALNCEPHAVTLADVDALPAHPGVVRTLREALAPDELGVGQPPTPGDTRLAIRALRRELRRHGRHDP